MDSNHRPTPAGPLYQDTFSPYLYNFNTFINHHSWLMTNYLCLSLVIVTPLMCQLSYISLLCYDLDSNQGPFGLQPNTLINWATVAYFLGVWWDSNPRSSKPQSDALGQLSYRLHIIQFNISKNNSFLGDAMSEEILLGLCWIAYPSIAKKHPPLLPRQGYWSLLINPSW